MTARDTIAKALLYGAGFDPSSDDTTALREAMPLTDAVIAAVRAMPVEDQAELIGGGVNRDHDLSTNRRIARVVGVWRDAR